MSDPYNELMPQVTDVKDLGSGVIRGVECDHLAFRTKEVDWQIWIAQGARPYPCRYVITSKKVKGSPQYTLDIRAWKAGGEAASDAFKLEIPPGAQKLTPGQIPDLDDIPSLFKAKEQSDYVQAHRCSVAGCNHLVLLPGARRTIRDSGLAGLHVHRRGRRRPPPDADECRRRRATDLASLCGRGLLLGRASAILPLKRTPDRPTLNRASSSGRASSRITLGPASHPLSRLHFAGVQRLSDRFQKCRRAGLAQSPQFG
jgi:hypothetical protein